MINYKELKELSINILNESYEKEKKYIENMINIIEELNIECNLSNIDNYIELLNELYHIITQYIVNEVKDYLQGALNEEEFNDIKQYFDEWICELYYNIRRYHCMGDKDSERSFYNIEYWKSDKFILDFVEDFYSYVDFYN